MDECIRCGSTELIPAWEEMERYEDGERPKFVGCTDCHTMVRTALVLADPPTFSQLLLTDSEMRRLRIGNQHTSAPSVVEWQLVKGAAEYYGVRDWTSKTDSTLTMEENIGLMQRHGTENNETTLREMKNTGNVPEASTHE